MTRPFYFLARLYAEHIDREVLGLRDHDRQMADGCKQCRAAVFGRVCPDCYHCRACGDGCEECAPVRADRD